MDQSVASFSSITLSKTDLELYSNQLSNIDWLSDVNIPEYISFDDRIQVHDALGNTADEIFGNILLKETGNYLDQDFENDTVED